MKMWENRSRTGVRTGRPRSIGYSVHAGAPLVDRRSTRLVRSQSAENGKALRDENCQEPGQQTAKSAGLENIRHHQNERTTPRCISNK
jgi:hypothetical protein